MSTDSAPGPWSGPVSATLEAELRAYVGEHGVAIWLDLDGHYTGFVDALMAAPDTVPYAVRVFRGSHLALLLATEGLTGGASPGPLVIHLPGFNEERVHASPWESLYRLGARFRKALGTVVTEAAAGRVQADAIVAWLAGPDRSLAAADAWLEAQLSGAADGLTTYLRTLRLPALIDDLLKGGHVASALATPGDRAALWHHLGTALGLTPTWRSLALPTPRDADWETPAAGSVHETFGAGTRAEEVAFAAASWALAVEYVDDLARPPLSPLLAAVPALPRAVIDGCRGLAAHLRQTAPTFYRRTADETEALLADEVEAARAEDLGKIDTFRFEEARVLVAALGALRRGAWDLPVRWASQRLDARQGSTSFWLRDDPTRQSAWQLVQAGARLGQAVSLAGPTLLAARGKAPAPEPGLEAALAAYVEVGAAVDQAHRHLEQRRLALLYPQIPEFETLRTALDGLRNLWRAWADAWARGFNLLCRAHGFLPPPALQQRHLFDEVVRPLAHEPGITALFVVDALRYEMGQELFRTLEDTPATTIRLAARLAELPTVTEVGMNVLAPVAAGGRLTPAFSADGSAVLGFAAGEFRVSDPETRKRAMHDRVGGATCPWLTLDEVLGREASALKRSVAQARLVVVHSLEIDHAGEQGVGPAVFDHVMQKLRAAWRLLREAGIRKFVFTSDHGFLLLDDAPTSGPGSTPDSGPGRPPQAHGRKIDPKRRHVFSPVAADHTGEVRVPLASLGYAGATGHLMFPESTAVFDTGRRPMGFVHGGNSLQERVIPVLTLVHRAGAGSSPLQYRVEAVAGEGVAGMHCLRARVEVHAQGALDFGGVRRVELALRAPEAPEVQVEMCQVRGAARLAGGAVEATVGADFELFFRLTGAHDTRVRVELHHPSALTEVVSGGPPTRFEVSGLGLPPLASAAAGVSANLSARVTAEASAQPDSGTRAEGGAGIEPARTAPSSGASAPTATWLAALPEGGVRQALAHLARHGVLTEEEATTLLGGQRALRRFTLDFERWVAVAPFAVRIEQVGGLKRYIKEGGE